MEDHTDHLSSYLPTSPFNPQQPAFHSIYDSQFLDPSPSNHQQQVQIVLVVSVRLQRRRGQEDIEEQQFSGFELDRFMEGEVCKLDRLLGGLCLAMNIVLESHQIMILNIPGDIFVNFGTYPLIHAPSICLADFCPQGLLTVRAVRTQWSRIHLEMSRDITQHLTDGPPRLLQREESLGQRQKTSIKNFQKIGYIVKKILNLKSKKGSQNQQFQLKNDRRLTKKSIEDYLYQIRQGFKYRFDFNANSNRNMKFLRDFVRERDDEMRKRMRKGDKDGLQMGNKPTRCSDESQQLPSNRRQ